MFDMSDIVETRCKDIAEQLRRLRFKTLWTQYMNDELYYMDFKAKVFELINKARKNLGSHQYTYSTFDNGWQWRTVCHDKYEVALNEMINFVFGWW